MPFRFWKRRKDFKHITHGLIPAATIAPKPAVPCTPSPCSPNPPPEGPRSALAAAVLSATLTGRTTALPLPLQKSENYSTCVEQECFEPYATVADLRMGPNWKLDGSDRSPVQSPEILGYYDEDEDTDTHHFDADIQSQSSCQSNEKKGENFSTNAIYAIPCKKKKKEFPPSPSTNADKKEVPSRETEFQVLVNESDVQTEAGDQHLGLNLKEKKSLAENLICGKPPPSPDVSIQTKQAWENMTKEKIRELEQENCCLSMAYQVVVQQSERTKWQMQEQELQLQRLEQENRRLKAVAKKSHREEEATELLSLIKQVQELVDENDALKRTVHRLNVELSRYQTKFRPLSQEECLNLKGLPMDGPPPPWLLDMKYLSPLLLAYEDRIREKEQLSLEYEEDMKNFKVRVQELVKENEKLHKQLNKTDFITPTEWQQLQGQAKLALEENSLLIQQLDIQQAKAKESQRQHIEEASKLTRKLINLEDKTKRQEEEKAEYQKQLQVLLSTCEELKAKLNSAVKAEEHFAAVNDLKSCLQQEQEKKFHEVEDLMGKIASLQAQNKKLLLEKNNFMADNKALETEMETTQKINRQLKKEVGFWKLQLEEAMENEVAAYHYIANLIVLAEKMAQKHDDTVLVAKFLENENNGVLNKVVEGTLRLGRLEEKVKIYKKKAAGKLEDISLKMTEQEKEFAGKTAEYQQEIKRLRGLLQDKQEALEEVMQRQKKTEEELAVIWESTSNENRRMRELLHKSQRNNRWSTDTVHEPHVDESSQDPVYRHDFSYCDVKLLSSSENQHIAKGPEASSGCSSPPPDCSVHPTADSVPSEAASFSPEHSLQQCQPSDYYGMYSSWRL
ncbi:centrosomal protein of 89 kDa isoform X1 [Falco peregrinus]|uniref:centrosomal protein of 89 kDa isoform X1 n=1 Tax=Falco peregrinus TaxID=8954 RepID=UPI002479F7AA|nr:centrosomal protein of 89 kDa isoform X1 [Falco peregrinus]